MDPLPNGQQLLLQRLMSAHVMSDQDAKELFESIVHHDSNATQDSEDNNEEPLPVITMGDGVATLKDAFVSINRQLFPCFGLEIVTMIDKVDGSRATQQYHAVVNARDDDLAKSYFEKAWNAHERAFVRLLLKHMIEQEDCALKRKDCVNLRSQLDKGFKLAINDAERLVQVLLDEQWLRVALIEDDDEDDSDHETALSQGNKKKRRRRESMHNALQLAPRAYMELHHYLQDLGLERIPQMLSHRAVQAK
jgi:hypothetical protein